MHLRNGNCAKLSLLAILIASGFLFAHATVLNPRPAELKWQLATTVSGVEMFYAISTCKTEEVVFLKVKNKNNYKVQVSWKEVFDTQLEKNVEPAADKKIIIGHGEIFEADCEKVIHPELVVLSSQVNPTYVVNISKFNFKNISVIKTN